jgi:hypothetical protein
MKYKADDFVVVYKGTPTYEDGALGKVVDLDRQDKSYLIGSLETILRTNGDLERVMESAKWVKETNLERITFKPSLFKRIYRYILGLFGG